jgi:hypothetical protein
MSDALQRWSEGGGRGAKKPRDRTIFEAKATLDRFGELHGDLPVTSVSKAHARDSRDTLIKVPKALPGKLAKLSLPELLKRDLSGFPQRSAQTVNKSLNLLGGVLARAERDGFRCLAWVDEPVPGHTRNRSVGERAVRTVHD